jgi:hypothetical protein
MRRPRWLKWPKWPGVRGLLHVQTDEQRQRWDDRLAFLIGLVITAVTLLAIIGAGVMVFKMYFGHVSVSRSENPLNAIFRSRLMITAARLAILATGLFIVLSILMHIRRGQWLTAAGPLKVSESVRRLSETVTQRTEQMRLALDENERLRGTISQLTTELRTSQNLLQKAQAELRRTGPNDR